MARVELYGGGTALGAVQVHTAEQLDAAFGLPDRIDGTSVGALTAVMRAQGALPRLRAIWRDEIKGARSFQALNLPDIWRGLFKLEPLRRKLQADVDPRRFQCDVYAHMVDLGTKRYDVVRLNSLPASEVYDALICSSTQYGIHEAARFGGRLKVDGGVRHVIPAIHSWRDYDRIDVISCSPVSCSAKDNEIPDHEITFGRSLELLVDAVEGRDYLRLRRWAEQREVWLYEPHERPGDPFDASRLTTRWRLETVGKAMWQAGQRVRPRPGLHMLQSERAMLARVLQRHGIDLDEAVAEARQSADPGRSDG